jgi:hypothetical protein
MTLFASALPTQRKKLPTAVQARVEVHEIAVSGPAAVGVSARRQRRPSQRSTSGTPGALPVPTGTAWPTAKHELAPGQATASRWSVVARYGRGSGAEGAVSILQRRPSKRSRAGSERWRRPSASPSSAPL